ncbi:MAG TPA: polyprenyl diphosphate synthase [Candidatus Paceibacterota bacterium]
MNQLSSLGIIMDGNRRFAREHSQSSTAGHRLGLAKVKEVLSWARTAGIKTVFLYAFSTENWRRNRAEVAALMMLFKKFLQTEVAELVKQQTRLVFIGESSLLSLRLKKLMAAAVAATAAGKKFTLVIAFSYGGRSEIVAAAKLFAVRHQKKLDQAGEEEFSQCLWTAGLPDPDLIIRTGGERRLSNFLPWQAVYSELYFTPTYWPAFARAEFNSIVADYRTRQRNYGR